MKCRIVSDKIIASYNPVNYPLVVFIWEEGAGLKSTHPIALQIINQKKN